VAASSGVRDRIAVDLPGFATTRVQRELVAFTRYCIDRIEREVGEATAWRVRITPSVNGLASYITVEDRRGLLEAEGRGHDGAAAIWDAMCQLEQRLRERR
jgi:hypothetical protein